MGKRMNNKAQIQISVNAIVILIIAIVMLGIGLGYLKDIYDKDNTVILSVPTPELPTYVYYEGNTLSVNSLCEDGVICYNNNGYNKASGSCFRDKDLVAKYCGGNQS